jgi:hypothetical protein
MPGLGLSLHMSSVFLNRKPFLAELEKSQQNCLLTKCQCFKLTLSVCVLAQRFEVKRSGRDLVDVGCINDHSKNCVDHLRQKQKYDSSS